ncbi:hypothetical protein TrLO_g9018 [Triparma laevis f. longispina]|uniref:EGF-like domain-containing protein n=1 Tax=Triparma laevis f. longispina TaxID=1714387 RepID=A0A9W7FER0_9STRA|nr:hypothetical protein TrLO_g9018 [Triparma laevis f. longispina]
MMLLPLLLLCASVRFADGNAQSFDSNDRATVLGCKAYNYCNGHGKCLYARNECECQTGWGSPQEVAVLGFRPSYDCTKKVCPFGYAWGDMPEANSTNSKKLTTDRAHQQEECSNMGFCDRDEGICECIIGFRGSSCQARACPGKGDCSGHGKCVSMKTQARMPNALPLSDANENTTSGYYEPGGHQKFTWDQERLFGCVCDSGWEVGLGNGQTQEPEWFGGDCSYKRCPTGDNPDTTSLDETNGFGVTAEGGHGVGKVGNLKHHDCSGKGKCDFKSGTCNCFAGFYGENCGIRDANAA